MKWDSSYIRIHVSFCTCGEPNKCCYTDARDVAFMLHAQANKKRKREDEEVLVYTRPEDQFFHKLCKWSFQWKTKDSEGE